MKTYLQNIPATVWALLSVPALLIAYSMVTMVLPAVARAVVPNVVRSVLSLL